MILGSICNAVTREPRVTGWHKLMSIFPLLLIYRSLFIRNIRVTRVTERVFRDLRGVTWRVSWRYACFSGAEGLMLFTGDSFTFPIFSCFVLPVLVLGSRGRSGFNSRLKALVTKACVSPVLETR